MSFIRVGAGPLSVAAIVAALILVRAALAGAEDQGAGPSVDEGAPEADPASGGGVAALESEPDLDLDVRLGALWWMGDVADEPRNEFGVSAARLELTWEQWDLVEASVGVEAMHLLDGEGDFSILRDLYVRVQPLSWLGVRLGQFKKPFSKNELRPRRKHPMIDRGMGNDYVVEHLMYGDRDIGAMLEGRLVKKIRLDYAIGVFNGLGKNTAEISLAESKDIAARIDARPAKWLSFGLDASIKMIDRVDLPKFVDEDDLALVDEDEYPAGYTSADFVDEHGWMAGTAWMTGADVDLKIEKLRVAAEGMLGENWWFERYPHAWSCLLMISYKWRLGEKLPLWLEIAVRGELLTVLSSWSEWRARLWQVAPAVNLHIGEHVRLMIDGEFVFAEGCEADLDGSRRDGLWPNEWPGELAGSERIAIQLLFEL